MTDRIDEIKARAGAATPGGELFARLTQECDNCYTPQAQLLRACTYHEGWLDGHGERDPDIDYLLAEVERLRAAVDTEKEANVSESVCLCGHRKIDHIYEEGACRPGYVCALSCDEFTPVVGSALTEGGES